MKPWLWIRIALVITGIAAAPGYIPRPDSPPSETTWLRLGLYLVFTVIALFLIVGIQAFNPLSAPTWRRPGWTLNPLTMSEPLQPFHLIAWHVLATGVAATSLSLTSGIQSLQTVAPLAIGSGCLLGVWLCVLVFRHKMEHDT